MQIFITPPRLAFRRPWPGTRRGFKLWLFAVVFALRGLLYVTDPGTQSGALTLPYGVPIQAWGCVVFAVCVFAAFTSYCHFGRDRWGYKAMTAMASFWAFLFAYGFLVDHAERAALQGFLSMLVVVVVMIHCAGDPELPRGRR